MVAGGGFRWGLHSQKEEYRWAKSMKSKKKNAYHPHPQGHINFSNYKCKYGKLSFFTRQERNDGNNKLTW